MLLWLDLETTGLDPQEDLILEVAWHFTDGNLNDLDDKGTDHAVVSLMPSEKKYAWSRMIPYVIEMHTGSGLLRDLDYGLNLLLEDIESQIVDELAHFTENGRPVFLAGASVHFDKGFIESYMPRLFKKVSHRVYDTSTLKAFFGSLGVEHDVINAGQHRAANDVDEVLAVARYYRHWVEDVAEQARHVALTGKAL